MTPPKAPPTLEGFYNVKQATVRLGLATESEDDTRGQKWLRDGVNRQHNPFPHRRMAGQLMFSDSDLAQIAEMSRTPATKPGRKRTASPRKRTVAKPTSATEIKPSGASQADHGNERPAA